MVDLILSSLASGLYFLRGVVDGRMVVARLLQE